MPPQTQTVKNTAAGQPKMNRRGSRRPQGQGDAPRNQAEAPPPQEAQRVEDTKQDITEDLDAGDTLCWICAEPVKYYSVSECNHRTCHICALRLRALYKKFECTFCKTDQPDAIFTTSPDQLYEDFDKKKFIYKDPKLAILFETLEMMENTLPLLRYNCPDLKCEYIAAGWGDLKAHVRAVHGRMLCDLCTRTKKIFAHEHTLYTPDQLAIHLPSLRRYESTSGNKARGEKIEGGVHPVCDFCREALYGEDEHFAHMRERHEECFVCKRDGVLHQYFQNYNSLEKHFISSHFPCTHAHCVAQKFVVFASALDLKAHMVEMHGESMSSKDLKDTRRVDANFAFEEIGRGRGRGNVRDREREAEREREREREGERNRAEAQASAESSAQARRRQAFSGELSIGNGSGTATPTQQPSNAPLFPDREDVDPLTREKHTAFMARASNLTGDSANAMAAIRSAVRSYRASEAPAKDLVNTFFNVLNQQLDSTGLLINGLVELFDDEDKKKGLLQAWNSFRVERREQFPAIAQTGVGTEYAGVTGGRILNIKHQTRGPSRSVWARVEQAATSSTPRPTPPPQTRSKLKPSTDPFPSLSTLQSGAAGPSGSLPPHSSTAWSLQGAPVSRPPPPSSSKIVLVPSEPRATAGGGGGSLSSKPPKPLPIRNENVFPGLPPSSNTRNTPKDAISGIQSLKNIKGEQSPSASAWGAGGGASSSPATSATQSAAGTPAATGAPPEARPKKKGKGKHMLYTIGSHRGA